MKKAIKNIALIVSVYLSMLGVATANNLAGSLPGEFSVSQNGAANYSIPIKVPVGIAGMQPRLALSYSSHGGNGLLGQGWTLNGLGAVTRCPATIQQDGFRAGVDFTADRFCLNGKRLRPAPTSSENTFDVSTIGSCTSPNEYRTEINNYNRIVSCGGTATDPDYFLVYTNDGNLMRYGASEDSRIQAQGKTNKLLWALNEIRDRDDNYLSIYYHEDSANGEYRPSTIKYTGGTGITANRVVYFEYESRTDELLKYVSGSKTQTTKRLKRIRTYTGANVSSPTNSTSPGITGTAIKQYVLNYKTGVGVNDAAMISQIDNINVCNGDETKCLPATTFEWQQQNDTNFTSYGNNISILSDSSPLNWNIPVDFNNDGIVDVVRSISGSSRTIRVLLRDASGNLSSTKDTVNALTIATDTTKGFYQWNDLADFNGDGILDLLSVDTNSDVSDHSADVWLRYGNNDGSFAAATKMVNAVTHGSSAVTNGDAGLRHWNQIQDMNGDGRADIFAINITSVSNSSHIKFKIHYYDSSKPSTFPFSTLNPTGVLAVYLGSSSGGFRTTNMLADVDGDSIVDIFKMTNTTTGEVKVVRGASGYTTESVGQEILDPIQFVATKYGQYLNFSNQLIDVNGDGVLDVVKMKEESTSRIGKDRTNFGQSTYTACTSYGPCTINEYHLYDGAYSSAVYVHLGVGDGTFNTTEIKTENVLETKGVDISPTSLTDHDFWDCDTTPTPSYPVYTNDSLVAYDDYRTDVQDLVYIYRCSGQVGSGFNKKGISSYNKFADINSDGFVDIIRLNPNGGKPQIAYGKGDGTFSSLQTPTDAPSIAAGLDDATRFTDVNGDGLSDIVVMDGTTAKFYKSSRNKPSLITSFTDGKGLNVTPTYKSLASNATNLISNTATVSYPQRLVKNSTHVVSDHSVNIGSSQTMTYQHRYYDAVRDYATGAFLVSRKEQILTTATPDKKISNEIYTQYPYMGLPKQSKKSVEGATCTNNWCDYLVKDTTWSSSLNGNVYQVYQTQSTETSYHLDFLIDNGTSTIELVNTTTFIDNDSDNIPVDEFGNPEKIEQEARIGTQTSGAKTTTTNTPNYNNASVYLGQLNTFSQSVQKDDGAGQTETRQLERTFYTDNGKLHTEKAVVTGTPDLASTTTYTYQNNGLIEDITVAGWDGEYDVNGNPVGTTSASRTTNHTYTLSDNVSYKVTKSQTVNGVEIKETTETDIATGQTLSVEDANQLSTSWQFDDFGRIEREDRPDGSYTTVKYLSADEDPSTFQLNGASIVVVSEITSAEGDTLPASKEVKDAANRTIRTAGKGFDGTTIYADTQYDATGRVWREFKPYFANAASKPYRQTEYDEIDRPTKVTASNGGVTTSSYDGYSATEDGIAITITQTRGDKTLSTSRYTDNQGRLLKVVDAANYPTTYSYYPFGELETITRNNNAATTITSYYNNLGQKTRVVDPDMGEWHYRYNAFGELKWQKDAKNQIITSKYDALGRLTEQNVPGWGISTWQYDQADGASLGRLYQSAGPAGDVRTMDYDSLGRVEQATVKIDDLKFTTRTTYDGFGRVRDVNYPSGGPAIRQQYNVYGFLETISDQNDSTVNYWKATEREASGQVSYEIYGNGIATSRTIDEKTGAVLGIHTSGASIIQDLSYDYDLMGNLEFRTDNRQGITESFDYDDLNRLTTVYRNGIQTHNYDFDALGNIEYKSGVGHYAYNGAQPHAVSSVTPNPYSVGTATTGDANGDGYVNNLDIDAVVNHMLGVKNLANTANANCTNDAGNNIDLEDIVCINKLASQNGGVGYSYDDNGNMTSGGGRTITYTAFNKPETIATKGQNIRLTYGAGFQRIKKRVNKNGEDLETTYVNQAYHRVQTATGIRHKYNLYAEGRVFATITRDENNLTRANYLHTDHLGSIDTITDENGLVVERFSFDPFGLRRQSNWLDAQAGQDLTSNITNKGYTGHEMDDESGLINMKARLYDPWLGRFLTPDSIIPDATNGQSLNRYSYVLNNPLKFVDPTGHSEEIVYFDNGASFDFGTGMYSFDNGLVIDSVSGDWAIGGLTIPNDPQYSIVDMGMFTDATDIDNGASPSMVTGVGAETNIAGASGNSSYGYNGEGTSGFGGNSNSYGPDNQSKINYSNGVKGETFYEWFGSDFLGSAMKTNPGEIQLLKEYGSNYIIPEEGDFRIFEVVYRNFDKYARDNAVQVINNGAADMLESLYGPQNAANFLPGKWGLGANIYNSKDTPSSTQALGSLTAEMIDIRISGPQVINEALFIDMFSRDYDSSLNKLIKFHSDAQ